MADDKKVEKKDGVTPAPENKDSGAPTAPATPAPSQDPIKEELEKVNKAKIPKSEIEQASHVLKSTAARIKTLGGDPAAIIGGDTPAAAEDDDAPVTVGMLKQREREQAAKTAETLAEEQIKDPSELELTKHYLATRIRPSGNPQEDLKDARALVNSVKNTRLAEEAMRRGTPKGHSSGSGAPAPAGQGVFEPTTAEATLMKPPFNLSKDSIIEARKKDQAREDKPNIA